MPPSENRTPRRALIDQAAGFLGPAPASTASLANRSDLRRAVFSPTAARSASFAVACAPPLGRASCFLKVASARASASALSTGLTPAGLIMTIVVQRAQIEAP